MDKEKTRLTSFQNFTNNSIQVNENTYSSFRFGSSRFWERMRIYTPEEIDNIIESGSTQAQIMLSRHFFSKGGFYQRILLHYATLLKYCGILLPSPSFGKSLSEPYIYKRYYNATNFLDKAELPKIFTDMAIRALRDGCYYGILGEVSNTSITLLTLPTFYCRTRFKSSTGLDLIEFDVTYFDSITDEDDKKKIMAAYPKVVTNWYRRYKLGKVTKKWVFIPSEIGICLPFLEDGRPMFLNIIPAVLEYDQARDINKERDLDEIRKIIVQTIPHLSDGGLLFEPDEAEVIHKGTVGMMKGNKNVEVLTTYANVDAITSKTSNDNATTSIEKSLLNIYSESGSSPQLFGTESNLSLATSINNDMALMMTFARKLDRLITYVVNNNFANSNISFKYTILPITHYNETEYINTTLKMANSGYSFLLPAIATGISQKELGELKELENDVLNLKDKLIPLSTSYTESSDNGAGRPELPVEQKSAKTIANEESLDSGGSISNGE